MKYLESVVTYISELLSPFMLISSNPCTKKYVYGKSNGNKKIQSEKVKRKIDITMEFCNLNIWLIKMNLYHGISKRNYWQEVKSANLKILQLLQNLVTLLVILKNITLIYFCMTLDLIK